MSDFITRVEEDAVVLYIDGVEVDRKKLKRDGTWEHVVLGTLPMPTGPVIEGSIEETPDA